MNVSQLIYTSCGNGNRGGLRGYMIYGKSSDITDAEADAITRAFSYKIRSSLQYNPTFEQIEASYPRALTLTKLPSGRWAIGQCCYIGADFTGDRYGNFMMHVFVFDEGQLDPYSFFRSEQFRRYLSRDEMLGEAPETLPQIAVQAEPLRPLSFSKEQIPLAKTFCSFIRNRHFGESDKIYIREASGNYGSILNLMGRHAIADEGLLPFTTYLNTPNSDRPGINIVFETEPLDVARLQSDAMMFGAKFYYFDFTTLQTNVQENFDNFTAAWLNLIFVDEQKAHNFDKNIRLTAQKYNTPTLTHAYALHLVAEGEYERIGGIHKAIEMYGQYMAHKCDDGTAEELYDALLDEEGEENFGNLIPEIQKLFPDLEDSKRDVLRRYMRLVINRGGTVDQMDQSIRNNPFVDPNTMIGVFFEDNIREEALRMPGDERKHLYFRLAANANRSAAEVLGVYHSLQRKGIPEMDTIFAIVNSFPNKAGVYPIVEDYYRANANELIRPENLERFLNYIVAYPLAGEVLANAFNQNRISIEKAAALASRIGANSNPTLNQLVRFNDAHQRGFLTTVEYVRAYGDQMVCKRYLAESYDAELDGYLRSCHDIGACLDAINRFPMKPAQLQIVVNNICSRPLGQLLADPNYSIEKNEFLRRKCKENTLSAPPITREYPYAILLRIAGDQQLRGLRDYNFPNNGDFYQLNGRPLNFSNEFIQIVMPSIMDITAEYGKGGMDTNGVASFSCLLAPLAGHPAFQSAFLSNIESHRAKAELLHFAFLYQRSYPGTPLGRMCHSYFEEKVNALPAPQRKEYGSRIGMSPDDIDSFLPPNKRCLELITQCATSHNLAPLAEKGFPQRYDAIYRDCHTNAEFVQKLVPMILDICILYQTSIGQQDGLPGFQCLLAPLASDPIFRQTLTAGIERHRNVKQLLNYCYRYQKNDATSGLGAACREIIANQLGRLAPSKREEFASSIRMKVEDIEGLLPANAKKEGFFSKLFGGFGKKKEEPKQPQNPPQNPQQQRPGQPQQPQRPGQPQQQQRPGQPQQQPPKNGDDNK